MAKRDWFVALSLGLAGCGVVSVTGPDGTPQTDATPQTDMPAPEVELVTSAANPKGVTFRWGPVPGAQSYRVREVGLDGETQLAELKGAESGQLSYTHYVPLALKRLAKYRVVACTPEGCGAAHEVVLDDARRAGAIGYIKAGRAVQNSYFGGSGRAFSADGTTLAIGHKYDWSGADGINGNEQDESQGYAGAVFVYVRQQGEWKKQAYIKAANSEGGDFFAASLSLSADGNTLAVGAHGEASNNRLSDADGSVYLAGAVYVFERSNGAWRQAQFLKAPTIKSAEAFGQVVRLSADGRTLAVAMPLDDSAATGVNGDAQNTGALSSGAVWIYVKQGNEWIQQAYIKATNTNASDGFGYALGLAADGNTLVVGAAEESSASADVPGDNSVTWAGAAYVYTRSGTTWTARQMLKAGVSRANAKFGSVVDVSGNGSVIAVGSPWEGSGARGINGSQSDTSAARSGAAYVFVRSGDVWQAASYIKASNADAQDEFGGSLALSPSGAWLLVGADREKGLGRGFTGTLTDNGGESVGAAYLFAREGSSWREHTYVKAPNAAANASFGTSVVVIDDGTFGVGATGEASGAVGLGGAQADTTKAYAGAFYVY